MIFSRQAIFLLVFCATGPFIHFSLCADDIAPPSPMSLISAPVNLMPPVPQAGSPVDLFRRLLAMSARDREKFLANKTPTFRALLLAKIHEYEALGPDERELRLRATELRWYLMPLLRESPTNYAAQLATIPEDVRKLVQTRLEEWCILPPPLQQEFLENERILHYFAHVDSENTGREASDAERAQWNGLPEAEQNQITAGFNKLFELTPAEKEKTLNTLSETERHQMETTLQAFEKMPPTQRAECVNAFARFASMTATDQAEFLKNAERWSAMSPAERQAWRDLVENVPQWPPLPPGMVTSPPQPPNAHPAMATNKN
jgi:hypothetical protein